MTNDKIINGFLLCIVLVYTLYMFFRKPKSGQAKNVVFWLCIFILLILGYAFRSELVIVKDRVLSVLIPSYSWVNSQGQLVIARSKNGHFHLNATGEKNQAIHFLVDTGASDVALTKEDAIKLGFDLAKLNYSRRYSTANGISYGAPVVIKQLTVNKKTFYNIEAHVATEGLDISLLGMSFLENFSNFKIAKDMLILEY